MKKTLFLTAISIIYTTIIYGQNVPSAKPDNNSYQTSKASKTHRDPLKLWNYKFTATGWKVNDTVRSIGEITFFRTQPVADGNAIHNDHKPWAPNIKFVIFNIADSAYCKKANLKTLMLTNCGGPYAGGDYQVAGRFIFVNSSLCVECASVSGLDYCRPVLKEIFDKLSKTNPLSLKQIISRMPIKAAPQPDSTKVLR
jgi:hypothetical protein